MKGIFHNSVSSYQFTNYTTTLAGTGWHHVAFSVDDTNNAQVLYLDGVAVSTTNSIVSISYVKGANSFIGTHGNGSTTYDFNGKIDDARIYNRALTAAEIQALSVDKSLTDTDTVAITVTAVNDAPVQVFNGTNFNGFYSYNDSSGNWFVQSTPVDTGTIQCKPQGGLLHLSSSAGAVVRPGSLSTSTAQ